MLNRNRTVGSKTALCTDPQSLGRIVIGERADRSFCPFRKVQIRGAVGQTDGLEPTACDVQSALGC